jgi:hypothetical protein
MTKHWTLIAAVTVCLGIGGCGKDDKKDGKAGDKAGDKGSNKSADKGSKDDKGAKSVIGGEAKVDLAKIIPADKALPFGKLTKEMLGMPKDELAKIDPLLVDVMKGLVHEGITYSTMSGRMMADGDKEKFKTHTLNVSFYADFKYVDWKEVKAELDKKWGAPIDHADFNIKDATSHFWFNPEAGVRAMLNGYDEKRVKMGFAAKIRFQAYTPLDKWLGAPDAPFPFLHDGKDLVGMPAADIKAKYEYEPKQKSASSLPYIMRTEWDGDQPPAIMVWVGEDDVVNKYSIKISYEDHPDGSAPLVAAIKAKWPGKELGADDKWAEVAANTWVKHEPGWKAYSIHVGEKPAGV